MDRFKLEKGFSNKAFHNAIMQASNTAEEKKRAAASKSLNNSFNSSKKSSGATPMYMPKRDHSYTPGLSPQIRSQSNPLGAHSQDFSDKSSPPMPYYQMGSGGQNPKSRSSVNALLPPKSNYVRGGSFNQSDKGNPMKNQPSGYQKANSFRNSRDQPPVGNIQDIKVNVNEPFEENKNFRNPKASPYNYAPSHNAEEAEDVPNSQLEGYDVNDNQLQRIPVQGQQSYKPTGFNPNRVNIHHPSSQTQEPEEVETIKIPKQSAPRPKGTLSINPRNIDRVPTIPEETEESIMSSYLGNGPGHPSTKSLEASGVGPSLSQRNAYRSGSPINVPPVNTSLKGDNVIGASKLEGKPMKQNTPNLESKKFAALNSEAVEIFIPEAGDRNDDREDIPEEEKQLEQNPDDEPEVATPKVQDNDSLVYFESKDPDPKMVSPVGGKGPALTKTLVKPVVNQPVPLPEVETESPEEPSPAEEKPEEVEDPEDNEPLDLESEELRKLEEEVARLQKEADENLGDVNEEAEEMSIIAEQTYIIDGKKKRKKKKKKKRKKIGGGEETIANITIDEVDDEGEPVKKEIKLNPVAKKKGKKSKKAPKTELGPVEEDSKEQSTIRDMKRLNTLDSQKFGSGDKTSGSIMNSSKKDEDSNDEEEVKKPQASKESNIAVPSKAKSKFSSFKLPVDEVEEQNDQSKESEEINHDMKEEVKAPSNKWKFPEDLDLPPLSDKHLVKSELNESVSEVEPPVMKQNVTNKKIIDIPVEEPMDPKETKLMYLTKESPRRDTKKVEETEKEEIEPEEKEELSSINISPVKTETHEKSTEDQTSVAPKFAIHKLPEKPMQFKKIKTISEKLKPSRLQELPSKTGIAGFPGTISLLSLN